MSFRRTFVDELRRQFSVDTESEDVGRIRFYAAGLSIFFGMVGLIGFLPMARGDVSWLAAPGCALMLGGGVLGIAVQRTFQVRSARRFGLWAMIFTVVGLTEFALVGWLAS